MAARALGAHPIKLVAAMAETDDAPIEPGVAVGAVVDIDEHPLTYPWTFTYFKKVANKSYEENTYTLGMTATVEDFWRLYVHLRRPVDERPTVCDYHVFREGIRPMWEDEANVRPRSMRAPITPEGASPLGPSPCNLPRASRLRA